MKPSPKVYVSVQVKFTAGGRMLPTALRWEDGTVYPIDRILDFRPASAEKAGGRGDRYTVRIGGQEAYLFLSTASNSMTLAPVSGLWRDDNITKEG